MGNKHSKEGVAPIQPEAQPIPSVYVPTYEQPLPSTFGGQSTDPLTAARDKLARQDAALLGVIFVSFSKLLPTYGTKMKKFMPFAQTTDYDFNSGIYHDRYKELEGKIIAEMESKGWRVKEFTIKDSKTKSKSALNRFFPQVRWQVEEPGTFKAK